MDKEYVGKKKNGECVTYGTWSTAWMDTPVSSAALPTLPIIPRPK